jgi:DNA-binding transcriptional MerR regulator
MAWSIAEVARSSGTTSRTLRHYHDIGLLEPAYIGDNGYRYYERQQLVRLQQILLLRELGLSLPVIARVLDGQQDTAAALHDHLRRLRSEQARLRRLQRTVERTLAQIAQGGSVMTAQDYFDGFDRRQEDLERELIERFGDDAKSHIDESKRRISGWTRADVTSAMDDWQEHLRHLAELMRQGLGVETPQVQGVIAGHHAWLTRFWTPDRVSYAGLGDMYADDPRFSEQIDSVAPGLAHYLRDAITTYAEQRVS